MFKINLLNYQKHKMSFICIYKILFFLISVKNLKNSNSLLSSILIRLYTLNAYFLFMLFILLIHFAFSIVYIVSSTNKFVNTFLHFCIFKQINQIYILFYIQFSLFFCIFCTKTFIFHFYPNFL